MDKNIVLLEGVISDDYKMGKTSEGKQFVTFSLVLNSFSKEYADSTESTHSKNYIRLFIYDKKLIDYLTRIEAHQGQRASVFGRLSSTKTEYRGKNFMSNSVICRDIKIVKTKSIVNSKVKNEQENNEIDNTNEK